MQSQSSKIEVMEYVAKDMDAILAKYLLPINTNWQPSDFLPDASSENFFEEVKELQNLAKELPYDYLAVLVGDMITEEALPTYESWLMGMNGVNHVEQGGWNQWIRAWTAEENRHGDLLNKFLYLSGRVNMKAVEVSTQYLIADGFDIGTGADPYKNFVYTSFQEHATNISHKRTAVLAKKSGNNLLAKICGQIAADEMRHAKAYKSFISKIFEADQDTMMLSFVEMMKLKISMPAHFLREINQEKSSVFDHFSDAAQRIGVYTTTDYIEILESLLVEWNIADRTGLSGEAEKARDFVMRLPERMTKIAERIKIPEIEYKFTWIA